MALLCGVLRLCVQQLVQQWRAPTRKMQEKGALAQNGKVLKPERAHIMF